MLLQYACRNMFKKGRVSNSVINLGQNSSFDIEGVDLIFASLYIKTIYMCGY